MKKYVFIISFFLTLYGTNSLFAQDEPAPICVSDWTHTANYGIGGYIVRVTFTLNEENADISWSFNTTHYSVVSQSPEGIVVDFDTDLIATEQNRHGSVIINACSSLFNRGCPQISYCHDFTILVP